MFIASKSWQRHIHKTVMGNPKNENNSLQQCIEAIAVWVRTQTAFVFNQLSYHLKSKRI